MKLPDREPIYSSSGEERRYYNSSYKLDFFPEDQDGDFLSQLHSDKGEFEFFISLPRRYPEIFGKCEDNYDDFIEEHLKSVGVIKENEGWLSGEKCSFGISFDKKKDYDSFVERFNLYIYSFYSVNGD